MENVPIEKILVTLLISMTVSIGYYRFKSNTSASDSKPPPLTKTPQISKIHEPNINVASKSIVHNGDIYSEIQAAYLIHDDEKRAQKLSEIASLWSLEDPESCLEWALSIANDGIGYEYIVAKIFSTLVGNNQYEKAIELLYKVPQGKLRDSSIGFGIWGLLDRGNVNIEQAAKMLSLIDSKEQMGRSGGTLVKELLAAKKLQDVKKLYNTLRYGMLKDSIGAAVLRNLALDDPLSGLDWIRSNPEMNNMDNFELLASGFARLDPLTGIKAADEISDTATKKEYLSDLLNMWAYEKPADAGKWIVSEIKKSNFDDMKNEFYGIAQRSFAQDQNLMLSQIEEMDNLDDRNAALLSASAAHSEYNPRKAAELILATSIEHPEMRSDAIATTAKNWLVRDPLEASKWIGDMVAGPSKDVAVSELVYNVLAKDKNIDMANLWAAQIRDPNIRAQIHAEIEKTKP